MTRKKETNITRYNPSFKEGLTDDLVLDRNKQKLTNKTKTAYGKSYVEIIFTDVFSFFNILLIILGVLVIYSGPKSLGSLFFLLVLAGNITIALYEDIKARILMGKLKLITQSKTVVVRNSKEVEILNKDIVLDDIVFLSPNSQIPVDGVILDGYLIVNESLLTGESLTIEKHVGDSVLSGSIVVGGKGYIKAEKIGRNSYIQSLQNKANKFKRSASQIMKSLNALFLIIGVIVGVIGGLTLLTYGLQGRLSTISSFKTAIGPIAGSLVGMIPSGLYLLTSVSLAVGVISLAQKRAQVQDFYSIEMLARTNILCVDKTGTITDGSMSVKEVELVTNLYSNDDVNQIVASLIYAENNGNFTAKALENYFSTNEPFKILKSISFTNETKFSAVTFENNKTFILGAPECINCQNKEDILDRIKPYQEKGFRVLLLAQSLVPIQNNSIKGTILPVAIIVLQDHIRESAKKTFAWFQNNNVSIRVISGDNPITVSEIARQAEIKDFDKYISLEGMSLEQVKEVATKYIVFGRVNPMQKEALILALKEAKNTVAMTGDGINDILALKRADCSIAMASGSEGTRNVSHLVLLDSNFEILPDVIAEGRRVVNNLQRTASLFLSKTVFVVFFSILFLMLSLFKNDPTITYPFLTQHMLIWEILGIGMSAFFIAIQNNNEPVKGKFILNTLKNALPSGALVTISVLIVFFLYFINSNYGIYTGVVSLETATSMSVIIFSLLGIAILFKVCMPFSKGRKLVLGIFSGLTILSLFISFLITSITKAGNIFSIDYLSLYPINYLQIISILAVLLTIYFSVFQLIEKLNGGKRKC